MIFELQAVVFHIVRHSLEYALVFSLLLDASTNSASGQDHWTTPPQFTASTLDGRQATGEIKEFSSRQIRLYDGQRTEIFSASDLLRLDRSAKAAQVPHDHTDNFVELTNGDVLKVKSFSLEKRSATLWLPDHLRTDANKSITLPMGTVRAFRRSANEIINAHWRQIRQQPSEADLIAVYRKGGSTIDYVEGVVEKIDADGIHLLLDDEPIRVDPKKVYGIVFSPSREQIAAPKELPVLLTHSGLRLGVSHFEWQPGSGLSVESTEGIKLNIPMAEISAIDFSAGRVIYLSDLDPQQQSWEPYFGFPAAVADSLARHGMKFDMSFQGASLSLFTDDTSSPGKPTTYQKGLALRSRSVVTYGVPKGFARFHAIAGIDPETLTQGTVVLRITGELTNGQTAELFEQSINGGDSALKIDLPIESARTLRIVVDYGKNIDSGDNLHLCEARITK